MNKKENLNFYSIFISVFISNIILADIILWAVGIRNFLNIGFNVSLLLAITGFIIFKSKAVVAKSNHKLKIKRYLFTRISLLTWANLFLFCIILIVFNSFEIYLIHPVLALAGAIGTLTLTATILASIRRED